MSRGTSEIFGLASFTIYFAIEFAEVVIENNSNISTVLHCKVFLLSMILFNSTERFYHLLKIIQYLHYLFIRYQSPIDTAFKYLAPKSTFPFIIRILLPMHVLQNRYVAAASPNSIDHPQHVKIRFPFIYLVENFVNFFYFVRDFNTFLTIPT